MKSNIAEVKAERDAAVSSEFDYRMTQKPITLFPFTHGDTVEAARAQIRSEMIQDMNMRNALKDNMKREKFENSGLGKKYSEGIPLHIEKDINLYPQGGDERIMLRDKFQDAIPFYLRANQPVLYKKPNENLYTSAMTEARHRFEEKLKKEKKENQKNLDDFHAYMDETSKFQELKDMKTAQSRALMNSVLQQ